MNVFYVTMLFPAGSEAFASNDIRTLLKCGINVSVHCLRFKAPHSYSLLKERGLETVSVSYNSIANSLYGIGLFLRYPLVFLSLLSFVIRKVTDPKHLVRSIVLLPRVLVIFHCIKRINPQVVHLFWGHYPALVGYLVKKYCRNIKLSMFLGAYDLVWKYGCSNDVVRMSDAVWTHCYANVNSIMGLGVRKEDISVVYRGVDLNMLDASYKREAGCRFISVGTLDPNKRMDLVLNAFNEIQAKFDSASLVILGDGSERDRLQQIVNGYGIDDKVEFKGHVAHDEVFQELTSSDFFLFFSNKESERLPNVVKEAMLAGCIVLVSYTIGIDELVTDKVNGYIVDPANISEINSIITDVVCSRELLCGVSGAARDVIINRFNIEDSMRQYIDKWDNLVND